LSNADILDYPNLTFGQVFGGRPHSSGALIESKKEHLAIISALKFNDTQAACRLLEHHIRNVQLSTEQFCMYMKTGGNSSAF
jgi:DNA-binding FadR family transcriptional regulator